MVKVVRSKIPINRIGQPEGGAARVAFPAAKESGFIAGAVIDNDGGALMI